MLTDIEIAQSVTPMPVEDIAAAESANNAVTGGSLIPTLTLGIPGESVTAVLMGGSRNNRSKTDILRFFHCCHDFSKKDC